MGWNDEEEDGEVVGDAAGEDEEVPGGVEVAETVEGEEGDAQCVSESSGAEPEQPMPADCVEEGSDCEEDEPALKEVDQG